MSTGLVSKPKFQKNQAVAFLGGQGIVKGYQPHAGIWFYAVEMEMGPEPSMGRIGYETTILLSETDINFLK